MVKAKRPQPPATPTSDGLRVFPHELRAGDRVSVGGTEWEMAARPTGYLRGKMVLASLRTTLAHPDPFVADVALYPGCQNDVGSTFYAPLLVLIGNADMVTPARFCEQMKRGQPASVPALELVVYPGCPHAFDMRLPTAPSSGCGSLTTRRPRLTRGVA